MKSLEEEKAALVERDRSLGVWVGAASQTPQLRDLAGSAPSEEGPQNRLDPLGGCED